MMVDIFRKLFLLVSRVLVMSVAKNTAMWFITLVRTSSSTRPSAQMEVLTFLVRFSSVPDDESLGSNSVNNKTY